MIVVKNIAKYFEKHAAVNDVSFDVAAGETLVLLGTSGSGKTTMLRMINRLTKPDAGDIFIGNENIKSIRPELLRRSIGYVLQGYGLFPHYTVAENIAIVPSLLNWPKAKIKDRVIELLNKLQLMPAQYMHQYPAALSGGEKQRVGLARALAADPPILLMDEPFGALDPITRAEVRNAFTGLDELKQKTIVLVTHDVSEAVELADKIVLMDKGNLIQTGNATDLLFNPANEFVLSFFAKQGLQLELQAIKLSAIWDDLPTANVAINHHLKSHQRLWDAIQLLTLKTETVVILDEQTGVCKTINFSQLQTAVKNHKHLS